ncbi:HET-domain-containing protein [Parathielavia hyrcaniae]|uniref:HET-domain-containing protein n=1 Tax=Parathielavia hyrcaniae TaxID=113614 RepID=A0AAN6PUX4_9PEZI|nr:HET-domain-containing protein [Parathielavia hyrcaniae]
MLSASRTFESRRRGVVQFHEHCPQRPYVELTVPDDAQTVTAASFTTVSRDQGWADSKIQSYTWWEVALRRPKGMKSDLGSIQIQHNRVANPELFEATTRWDAQSPDLGYTVWLRSLRPGDVIQLVSKAVYPGWVNIVQEATIKIEYLPVVDDAATVPQPPPAHSIPPSYYRPLEHMDQEIRLLVVKPGRYDEAVHACFAHTSLSGNPSSQQIQFDALSYCWGDSPERVNIALDTNTMGTVPLNISGTVARAIRRLRSPDTPLRIWIDAICINQTDMDERSQQVRIMGTIYSRAPGPQQQGRRNGPGCA